MRLLHSAWTSVWAQDVAAGYYVIWEASFLPGQNFFPNVAEARGLQRTENLADY
jgi:hypothetical protein